MKFTVLVAAVGLFALSACGSTTSDRAISGAGIGAASGAIAGALFPGLSVVTGALVGTAIGGGVGAISDPEKINLGTPVWR